jgi:hypothetical protein
MGYTQSLPEVFFLVIKRPGLEAENLPPHSVAYTTVATVSPFSNLCSLPSGEARLEDLDMSRLPERPEVQAIFCHDKWHCKWTLRLLFRRNLCCGC